MAAPGRHHEGSEPHEKKAEHGSAGKGNEAKFSAADRMPGAVHQDSSIKAAGDKHLAEMTIAGTADSAPKKPLAAVTASIAETLHPDKPFDAKAFNSHMSHFGEHVREAFNDLRKAESPKDLVAVQDRFAQFKKVEELIHGRIDSKTGALQVAQARVNDDLKPPTRGTA